MLQRFSRSNEEKYPESDIDPSKHLFDLELGLMGFPPDHHDRVNARSKNQANENQRYTQISGDTTFATSTSQAVSQVISKASTTTTLVSSQNPSTYGQSVTFTTTVTPQFSGTPTGNVVFKDSTKTLKTVALSGGVASYTASTLAIGTHSITATYNGSSDFITSSAALTQTVQ